jgi:Fe-S cluster assembly ATP-binding protein
MMRKEPLFVNNSQPRQSELTPFGGVILGSNPSGVATQTPNAFEARRAGGSRRSQILQTTVYLVFAFMKELNIEKLHVAVSDQEIVRGLTLRVPRGEVHALMGPNGSGKSTLAKVLAGHPDYHVTAGKILMDGEDVLKLEPDERARRGLFMAFQYPSEIPGVTIANFLRAALQSRLPEGEELEATDYYARLYEKMELLAMDRSFTSRAVNEGFSGGEKKRTEILQMAMLEPKYAVLDETDSGLDIDALKTVAHGVNSLRGPDLGILLITHYQRLLNYIVPDHVHVMVAGRIVRSGRKELALELEERGYDWARDGAIEPAYR